MKPRASLLVCAILLVLLLSIASPALGAAAGWTTQISGTTSPLLGVDFPDSSHGWAVGDWGTIVATSNGGATWSPQTTRNTASRFCSVDFVDATHGWIVGEDGSTYSTANGGVTWIDQSSGTYKWLNSVAFVDTSHGWAVGALGTILATSDGGVTWSPQGSGTSHFLYSVTFVDASRGWAVGEGGTILATNNGGGTWSAQTSGTTVGFRSVSFSDAAHGWAVGEGGMIRVTGNGGATWSAQASGTSEWLESVVFTDASHGWAVGVGGTIRAFKGRSAPTLGRPACPASARHGAKFKVFGALRPHFRAAAKTVTLKAYRYANGRWRFYESYAAVNFDYSTYTRYTAKFAISRNGKYRFKAFTAATAAWAAANSNYSRTLTIK